MPLESQRKNRRRVGPDVDRVLGRFVAGPLCRRDGHDESHLVRVLDCGRRSEFLDWRFDRRPRSDETISWPFFAKEMGVGNELL